VRIPFFRNQLKKGGIFKRMPPGISRRSKPVELIVDLIKTLFHGLETVVIFLQKLCQKEIEVDVL
jgi:hypothetical protein